MSFIDTLFPGAALRRERTRTAIAETVAQRKALYALEASIPTFAQDRDEGSWKTASGSAREPLDYTAQDITTMQEQALEMSYTPGGRGLLDTMENFVIGKEMTVHALDENPQVQEFWDSWLKVNRWDTRSKECLRRHLRDGEIFLRWFKPKVASERPAGQFVHQKVRFVEPTEIESDDVDATFGIKCDPEDVETVIEYHRSFTLGQTQRRETIPADEMIHWKHAVDSNVKRGRSWLIGVAKYIRKYEKWLDMRESLNRIRTLVGLIGETVPGANLTTLKNKFTDTTDKTVAGEGTPKKMPKEALVLLQRGIKWRMESLNINAQDAAEDGRNIQLYICAGTQLTEYVVRGDASNANFASTMVSESPMVRMFEKYQDAWEKFQQEVFEKVIRYGIESGQLPSRSTQSQDGAKAMAAAYHAAQIEAEKAGNPPAARRLLEALAEAANDDKATVKITECQVDFPTLIHRDLKEETEAYTMHRQQGWASDRTVSAKLGYDYDAEKEEIDKTDSDQVEKEKAVDQNEWS
jgi:hypothetical protein